MKKKLELSQIRFKYKEDKLSIKNSNNNPFNQFSKWMNQAIKNKVFEPTAMSLATIDKKKVSNRIVLLKNIKNNTFVFYTNIHSRKAKDFKKNRSVAAVFWWHGVFSAAGYSAIYFSRRADERSRYHPPHY